MNIGDKIDKQIEDKFLVKFSDLSAFRSDIILRFGPAVGALTHGRFQRTYKNGDEIWRFDDHDSCSRDGYLLFRNGIILDIEYA